MADRLLRLVLGLTLCIGLTASAQTAPTCSLSSALTNLSGQRPLEITKTPPGTCGFLQFAWQDFLALNWPPLKIDAGNTTKQARGLPDTTKTIGQVVNAPTVWEQSQPNWYLFSPNNPPPQAASGQSFAAWNQYAWLPAACGPLQKNLPAGSPPPRILSSLSKFDAGPGLIQAFGAPMIDQNGYYVRYEILMDYTAFNYINSSQFYLLSNVEALANAGQTFSFPVQVGSTPGATFIKAAWKTLSAAEINSGRYHTAQAFLYTPNSTVNTVGQTCSGPVTVGLVGLHIVQKTQNFPLWMWATFEQVDNTPADPSNPGTTPPEGWGFFQPGSTKAANQQPSCPDGSGASVGQCDWQPTSSHMGTNSNDHTGGPTQAVRNNTIPNSPNQTALGQINTAAQKALQQINASTEWQYYELVEAQWQTAAMVSPCTSNTQFFPTGNVANMTMETYEQSNSCMDCHTSANAPAPIPSGWNGTAVCSDMVFELSNAWQQSVLPASRVPGLARKTAKSSSKTSSSASHTAAEGGSQ